MKRILLTREEDSDSAFYQGLKKIGITPIVVPVIQIQEKEFSVEDFSQYTWLFFTSGNGVKIFFTHYQPPPSIRIGVVGEKTKRMVESLGYGVHFMPSVFTAEVFVKEVPSMLKAEDRLLFVRGNMGNDILLTLRTHWELDEVVVYDTCIQSIPKLKEAVNGIVFASPSAVRGVCQSGYDTAIPVFCIGPTTAHEAKKQGFQFVYTASVHTTEGLLQLIEKEFL